MESMHVEPLKFSRHAETNRMLCLTPFAPIPLTSGGTIIRRDDGEVIYRRADGTDEILAEKDSLCGVVYFETGIDDPMIDCCGWHDHAYSLRAWFEAQGWLREEIDAYFLELMLYVANEQTELWKRLRYEVKAREYYFLVRTFGDIFYSKHPKHHGEEKGSEIGPKAASIHEAMDFALRHVGDDKPDWWKRFHHEKATQEMIRERKVSHIGKLDRALESVKKTNPKVFVFAYLDPADDYVILTSEATALTQELGLLSRAQFLLQMYHDGHIKEEERRR